MSKKRIHSNATISPCNKYRYVLRRTWNERISAIGIVALNPSTADATADDPTVKKCVKLARFWGYGGIVLVNLFAWRATEKKEIKTIYDPIGPNNDKEIQKALNDVDDVLVAWGEYGAYLNRSTKVRAILKQLPKKYVCIKQNISGEPTHPLYQKDDSANQLFPL